MAMHRKAALARVLGSYTIVYISLLYIPVALIVLFSFNNSIYVTFPLKGFTLSWYRQMVGNATLIGALQNSLLIGAVVACISSALGMLAAKAFTRYRIPGRGPIMIVGMAPLVIPGVILGVSLLAIFNAIGIPLSLYTIGMAHIVVCTPFAMLVMISRFEGFDKSLDEAASDLGETPWMVFWRVTFPLVLPGLIASVLLTFTISFDEFVLAFFLSGNEPTLPVYIWAQLRFPKNIPVILALAATILVVSFFIVSFSEWLRHRGVTKGGESVS